MDDTQLVSVNWVDEHLFIIIGDSWMVLSEGFLIVASLIFALLLILIAVRLWQRQNEAA